MTGVGNLQHLRYPPLTLPLWMDFSTCDDSSCWLVVLANFLTSINWIRRHFNIFHLFLKKKKKPYRCTPFSNRDIHSKCNAHLSIGLSCRFHSLVCFSVFLRGAIYTTSENENRARQPSHYSIVHCQAILAPTSPPLPPSTPEFIVGSWSFHFLSASWGEMLCCAASVAFKKH